MATIAYEATCHRLRVSGRCAESERSAIEDAIVECGRRERVLIVDLSAVEWLDPFVAEGIACACGRLTECRVSVLRRHGTEVDRVLKEQES